MLLAIDIGNSNIVIGGIDGDDIRFEARIATDRITCWTCSACRWRR